MIIEYRDGLLFTSIEILFRGQSKIIDNVVIDTGASQTLISQDAVDDIGIKASGGDEIVTSYGIGGKEHSFVKTINKVKVGDFTLDNCTLDFTSFQYEDINGLLGLDLLLEAGSIIDLKKLRMDLRE